MLYLYGSDYTYTTVPLNVEKRIKMIQNQEFEVKINRKEKIEFYFPMKLFSFPNITSVKEESSRLTVNILGSNNST